jgi:undecaprenyl-diphosphatase
VVQRLLVIDRRISAHLRLAAEARICRVAALVIAHSGDSLAWLVGSAAVLAWGEPRGYSLAWRVLIGTLTGGLVAGVLKVTFRRRRPAAQARGLYALCDRHAFPSGHATRCACLVVLLAPSLSWWGILALSVWAGGVGLARVALAAHAASDVIAGWIVGLGLGVALQALLCV